MISGSAMIKDETRCIRCGLCAMRCPVGTITMEAYTRAVPNRQAYAFRPGCNRSDAAARRTNWRAIEDMPR